MIYYLSGPMTGLEDYNRKKFNVAEKRLAEIGIDVVNPARLPEPKANPTWLDWMRVAITHMLDADGIILLPGWHKSEGAKIEKRLAEDLGLETRYLSSFFPEV